MGLKLRRPPPSQLSAPQCTCLPTKTHRVMSVITELFSMDLLSTCCSLTYFPQRAAPLCSPHGSLCTQDWVAVLSSLLQMRMLRLREVRRLAQGEGLLRDKSRMCSPMRFQGPSYSSALNVISKELLCRSHPPCWHQEGLLLFSRATPQGQLVPVRPPLGSPP